MAFEGFKQVGEFAPNRQPVTGRMRQNPIDVCTIVSIYPRKMAPEVKIGLQPGVFEMPYGSLENPGILHVGSSSWWFPRTEEGQPSLEIPVFSILMAESLIKDCINGMLACDMDAAMPGFFFVEGKKSVKEIKTDYADKLKEVDAKQKNWYTALVRLADSLWARAGGNPLALSEDMRLAANELGMKDRPWLKDFKAADLVACKGCGNFRNPLFPICPSCKLIDKTHPLAGEMTFAS